MAETKVTINELVNPYKARAFANADYAFADAAWTKVTLNTESYDPNSNFASSTYTVPITGYYQVNGAVRNVATAFTLFSVAFYVDGAVRSKGYYSENSANQKGDSISDILYLTAGQALELYAYADATTGSNAIQGGADGVETYMSVHLLSV